MRYPSCCCVARALFSRNNDRGAFEPILDFQVADAGCLDQFFFGVGAVHDVFLWEFVLVYFAAPGLGFLVWASPFWAVAQLVTRAMPNDGGS